MSTGYVVVAGNSVKPDKYTILKDDEAVLDYPFNWTDWLAENDPDDTITGATGSVTGGIVIDSVTVQPGGLIVTPVLSGGTPGETATFTMHIVTAGGREDDRTIHLKIRER